MVKTSAPILEQSCPACGGLFMISAGSRRKKVQCPQCREVVSLTPHAEVNGTPDASLTAVPEWMARCEKLQARIEALEQQVEALMVTPRNRAPLIAERRHDFSAVSREIMPPGDSAENHDAPARTDEGLKREVFRAEELPSEVAARTFHPPTPEIMLLVAAGDGAARQLAETLTKILVRVGWKVRGVIEGQTLSGGHGLTLTAGPALPLERVTSTLKALREAGFAMTFQLDPGCESSGTTLFVEAGGEAENEAGLNA